MEQTITTTLGILELSGRSDGRLRILDQTLLAQPNDPVVPGRLIDRYALRPGDLLEVTLQSPPTQGFHPNRAPSRFPQRFHGQRYGKPSRSHGPAANAPWVQEVIFVEGLPADQAGQRRRFEDLTSIDPQPRLTLEYPGCPAACRLIDLFCPIGFGQRGMIVSPPKAGKTTLLHNIAMGISHNHPNVQVIALLVDERPEEVTDFRRNVPCTVLASSNDHGPQRHVALAMLAIDRAKRMVEAGHDVVVLLDSLTRLGRAFNNVPGVARGLLRPQESAGLPGTGGGSIGGSGGGGGHTGRTMSGGLDSGALMIPKQLFGAARKFESLIAGAAEGLAGEAMPVLGGNLGGGGGGSLTIIATALVDTGSRADQVIFEEFKGTGNMELILDRSIAEQRLFPAINLAASGTRKEHLLLSPLELEVMGALRRRLLNMSPPMQVEQLLKALERFKTNEELVGNPQSPANPNF